MEKSMAIYQIKSEITGMVCKVLVRVGDQVSEDDPVVMVDSMKMEIPVSSPRAGRVTGVNVAEGDAISEGDCPVAIEVR
jgi:acetyl-CoA carboxylase biotin carboxyl carrier protein